MLEQEPSAVSSEARVKMGDGLAGLPATTLIQANDLMAQPGWNAVLQILAAIREGDRTTLETCDASDVENVRGRITRTKDIMKLKARVERAVNNKKKSG